MAFEKFFFISVKLSRNDRISPSLDKTWVVFCWVEDRRCRVPFSFRDPGETLLSSIPCPQAVFRDKASMLYACTQYFGGSKTEGVSPTKVSQGTSHQKAFLKFVLSKILLHKLCTRQKNPTSCLVLNMLRSLSNSRFCCHDLQEDSLLCFNPGRHAIIKLTQAKCFFDISSCLWWL